MRSHLYLHLSIGPPWQWSIILNMARFHEPFTWDELDVPANDWWY